MKITIRHIINLYLYSSLHIGLCCVLLYLFTINRFHLEIDNNYLIFLLASTIFTYSIHRIIGMSKVKKFEHQGRFAIISKYRRHIIFYAVLGGLACMISFFSFSINRMRMLFFAGATSILYTLPIFGKSMRLRDFSFIKIFLIAIVWSIVTESIPLYENGIEIKQIIFLFLERALFFIAITIPFDIRDIEVDTTNSVRTIPTAIGKTKAIYLSIFLLILCILIEGYLYSYQSSGSVSASLAYTCTVLIVLYVTDKKDDYYFSGLMDGTIMLPWLFIQLFT